MKLESKLKELRTSGEQSVAEQIESSHSADWDMESAFEKSYQAYLQKSGEVCYDRYALIINEKQSYERSKACLDGMYNISNFTMELCRNIKNNDTLAILFYPIADRFKNNKLNEIRLPWINMIS
ncbi:MAG: hypothetical protein K6F27_10515 [Ruminococcus sp.]|nr:hypothetical protein [Ruminococcus sp.]